VGTLMVRCPETGQDFPTGIETDQLSLQLTPAFTGTIHCPLCGVEHNWSKIDAWVRETPSLDEEAA
jgi:hypothetical protein